MYQKGIFNDFIFQNGISAFFYTLTVYLPFVNKNINILASLCDNKNMSKLSDEQLKMITYMIERFEQETDKSLKD